MDRVFCLGDLQIKTSLQMCPFERPLSCQRPAVPSVSYDVTDCWQLLPHPIGHQLSFGSVILVL